MIKYLKTELGIPHDASFLDLGTGNGTLIFKLFEEGFDGIHVGVDYSEASIKLVKEKSEEIRAQKESEHDLSFWQYDILRGEHKNWMPDGGFDVVLDKGTFDAISLSSETDQTTGKRVFHNYAAKVIPLIKKGGRLLITSCNWTESELKGWFEAESRPGSLKYQGRISYPTFQFGGATGQSVCSLCFLRES
jgi:SAM-dependent methyltransferase